MKRVMTACAAAAVAAGLAAAAAQPPGGDAPRDKKGPPVADKKGGPSGPSGPDLGRPAGAGGEGRPTDLERMFNLLSKGTDTIDFEQLPHDQKVFVKAAFERMGLPTPPATGTMTNHQFMAAVARAQAAKSAPQPGGGVQPPSPASGQPGVNPFPGPPGFGPQPEKLDPQVEAWVKTLTDKMNDPHDAIRDSARAALVAVGGPAVPALKQLAGGSDAKAFTARRIVQQIERGPGMPGMGGFGGAPGFPGAPGFNPPPGGDPRRPSADNPPMPPGGRDGKAGREANAPTPLGRILNDLALTDAQRKQAEQVVEGYAAKMREVFEKARTGGIDRTQIRDVFTKLADDATADLKRVLTREQRRRFEELTPPGRSLFPVPGGPGEGAPGRPDPNAPERPREPRPATPGEQ